MRTVALGEALESTELRKVEVVERFLQRTVEEMIDEAAQSYRPNPVALDANPKLHLPLIR